jgi:hypothetical protein
MICNVSYVLMIRIHCFCSFEIPKHVRHWIDSTNNSEENRLVCVVHYVCTYRSDNIVVFVPILYSVDYDYY